MGFDVQPVLGVRHWSDRVFSLRVARPPSLRFENGQFVMMGLAVGGKPLVRAYSIANPNYDEHLEFLSIKVPGGPLTSVLKDVRPGDPVLVGRKPTGTLLLTDLRPGRRLYLFATGTGLAPFMGTVADPYTYERFASVVLLHGVRRTSELAYRDVLEQDLRAHPYVGEMARRQLHYVPCVSREDFHTTGRITRFVEGDALSTLGLPPLDPATDRAMLCGSQAMLAQMCALLDQRGFQGFARGGLADYVIERAFTQS
ncbi:ferredoxin--NADP reductase [Ramlibacter sp.]|uniref:ferredoxin--NADP reductase n=1 Tax=Ramlibacter sp. TaxID=1917967 RepID=UPI0017C42AF1|nr:ferredoxin--NADP reductase [Ramlibacter sp.]MBA2676031.1 ferredoxin--NADP reductase [Ramlibacter sp.]